MLRFFDIPQTREDFFTNIAIGDRMGDKRPVPPLYIAMDTGEALARFIQTRPQEVTVAASGKRKTARPEPGSKGVNPKPDRNRQPG